MGFSSWKVIYIAILYLSSTFTWWKLPAVQVSWLVAVVICSSDSIQSKLKQNTVILRTGSDSTLKWKIQPSWYSNCSMDWTCKKTWVDSWQGQDICLHSKISTSALGPTQPPSQQVQTALTSEVAARAQSSPLMPTEPRYNFTLPNVTNNTIHLHFHNDQSLNVLYWHNWCVLQVSHTTISLYEQNADILNVKPGSLSLLLSIKGLTSCPL